MICDRWPTLISTLFRWAGSIPVSLGDNEGGRDKVFKKEERAETTWGSSNTGLD